MLWITVSDYTRYVDACLAPHRFFCLQTLLLQAIWWTTLVSCAWFPGGWCGPDGSADRQQRASSRIHGLLPSTSPFDIIDDWQWLYLVQEIETYRHESTGFHGLNMFDSNMYIATTSTLTWCIAVALVFHTTSLLPQLPKNYNVFWDISGRLFLKIYEDGFAVPLQLVFLEKASGILGWRGRFSDGVIAIFILGSLPLVHDDFW